MLTHCGTATCLDNVAQDRAGSHSTEAGYIREIDAENPIEFAPQIERSRFIMSALVGRLFRPRRRCRVSCR
jgi:hypothetical protein